MPATALQALARFQVLLADLFTSSGSTLGKGLPQGLELSEGGGPALPHLLHYHHQEPEVEAAHVRQLGWSGNGAEEHLEECRGLQDSCRRKLRWQPIDNPEGSRALKYQNVP